MPFPEKLAKWYIRASGGRSLDYTYSERRGFSRSNNQAQQVHHIEPESMLLEQGIIDPNTSPALPLHKEEHVGLGFTRDEDHCGMGRQAIIFEPGHSFHPDMGQALYQYRDGDKQAFKKAAHEHVVQAQNGVSITNSDCGADQWLSEQAQNEQWIYHLEHADDPKPDIKPNKKFVRKSWTDIYIGTRSYPKDEES